MLKYLDSLPFKRNLAKKFFGVKKAILWREIIDAGEDV
jgi:hypothetical protein